MKGFLAAMVLGVSGLGFLIVPALAAETVKTAEQGKVRAELTYEKAQTEGFPQFKNVRLKISRSGQPLLNQMPPINEYDRPIVDILESSEQPSGFVVQDLDGDREPEVVVDFYTGGAHCCTYSLIYRFVPSQNRYESLQHPWGNVGYRLVDLDRDGRTEFQSADDRFAYAFASYAGSGFPAQIWRYQKGDLVDVTRQFPKQVYQDASQWWKLITEAKSQESEVKGILAAYLADKYLLNQQQEGWQRVQQVYQARDRLEFFKELRRFLKETGYEN
jgi:hypothetical protein